MGHYLKFTNGKHRNTELTEDACTRGLKSKCHNNDAERPFAVIKALAKQHPSMSLRFLAALANGKVNGTCRLAEEGGKTQKTEGTNIVKAGVATVLHPLLQRAVTTVTSVREASVGVVTMMMWDD
jgi:hypothetical protein